MHAGPVRAPPPSPKALTLGRPACTQIKEYLATGTVKALSGEGEEGGGGGGGSSSGAKTPAGKEGKALEGKGRADALQFM